MWPSWILWLNISYVAEIKAALKLQSHLEIQLEKYVPLSSFTGLLASLRSLLTGWSPLPPHRVVSSHRSWSAQEQSTQESMGEHIQNQSHGLFLDLILEALSHYFLSIKSESQGLNYTQREEYFIRAWTPGGRNHEVFPVEASCHNFLAQINTLLKFSQCMPTIGTLCFLSPFGLMFMEHCVTE